MKRLITNIFLIFLLAMLFGCSTNEETPQIAATTLPVYEFTNTLCSGTGITVTQVITEEVSCLHDYTLQVRQLRILEGAEMIVISGAGLESFLEDVLDSQHNVIDASTNISIVCREGSDSHNSSDDHHHEVDPHYWLSPANAHLMASTIYTALCEEYPEHKDLFTKNFDSLEAQIVELEVYANEQLDNLKSREIITFHDGFSYLADAYDLQILETIEEESGSEASAAELIDLCELVRRRQLQAIFAEKNGSTSAATIIANETGVGVYNLDMAISGDSYFTAMRCNIDTLKEALG